MWPFSSSKQNKNAVDAASYISIKETTEEAEIDKMVSKLEQIFSAHPGKSLFCALVLTAQQEILLGHWQGRSSKKRTFPIQCMGL
ncbi:hypothetical protein M5V91_10105 [Cytobacillus pseudoceanisediminis]|uniref:hypothetical protein n=1 Tax=Cytobacillus pseudoceanisediminis TaxID=3051614 RepID=UPI00218A0E4C|nr:hypothetical protein [Cytobacillus pseudoceanisediminis]UQX56878.1 hypothetical protein M5V91_10105 [Cytobacillus pseudoceanisediminis]